jgi:signal peptidase
MRKRQKETVFYVAFVAAIATAILTVYLLGLSFYVITGGSMEGAVHKGAIAIERKVPVDSLQVGDIITFQPPGMNAMVTHRITAIDTDAEGRPVYSTKGDANQTADPWHFTLDRKVQARFVADIPWIGYAFAALTLRTVRTAVLAGIGLVILVLVVLWYRESSREAKRETIVRRRGAG